MHKLFDFTISQLKASILHQQIITIDSIENDKKEIEIIGKELLIYFSYPYRKYIRLHQGDTHDKSIGKDSLRINLQSNYQTNEMLHSPITVSIADDRQIFEELQKSQIVPVLSFVLMCYFQKHNENKDKKQNKRKKCSIIFGAFHLSLDLINPDSVFRGAFWQIKNDREGHKNKQGELVIEIGSISDKLYSLSKNKPINIHDGELDTYKEYNNLIELIKKQQIHSINEMDLKIDKNIFISYTEINFTLSSLYIVPIEFFPLVSYKEDYTLSKTTETVSYFENLIELASTMYCKSTRFWEKSLLVLRKQAGSSQTEGDEERFINEELAQLLGHVFRAAAILLPYCNDYSFIKDKLGEDDVYQDAYTNKSGDCEDFSCSIYRTIRIFRNINNAPKKIRVLQKYLNFYVPFIAKMISNPSQKIGIELNEMELHTVCVLLPKSKIEFKAKFKGFIPPKKYNLDHIINTNKLSPLFLDGTNRTCLTIKTQPNQVDEIMQKIKTLFPINSGRIQWDEDKFRYSF